MRAGGYKPIFLASLMLPELIASNGCSGKPPPDPADTETTDISPATATVHADPMADEYIMEAIYLNKRVPEGFYREPTPPDDVFQTIEHIKNIDIASVHTPVYELCTDSADEALEW